jgi:NAD(P)-dependent dehydrogenase (short-subunit alcohol dehydrogenase family)
MLTSARVLVVGASAGIGRAFAKHAIAQGAQVCVAARRADALEELCRDAGGGTALPTDVTDVDACRRLAEDAAAAMGEIDLLLFTAGSGQLRPIDEADAEAWRRQYDVNVVGPTLVTGAALPHLSPDAVVAFVSSESTHEPRWGLSSYTATKAALDATIRSWRVEHPERRFMRIVMGATAPTDFGTDFDPEILGAAFEKWVAGGIAMTLMETETVGRHLAETMAVVLAHPSIDVPDLCLDPRGEAWT